MARSMSSAPTPIKRPKMLDTLQMKFVDKVAGWLMSFVILVGIGVLVLLMIFLSRTLTFPAGEIEVVPVENVAGRGDNAEGFARDFEPPGAEEVEEMTEPTLAESLEAVTSAVTNVAASLDSLETNSSATSKGKGRGDSRPPGPMGEGDDIVPRFERWELKFAAKNMAGYSAQLDFFKIELGAMGGGVKEVEYTSGFAGAPSRRSAMGSQEKRLYFMWRKTGPLLQYDRQLLQRAGIQTNDRVLIKFIPKELEDRLAITELAYAKTKGIDTVKKIAKTIFESKPTSTGFEWAVVEQRYRLAK
jgi:hypothetical protein